MHGRMILLAVVAALGTTGSAHAASVAQAELAELPGVAAWEIGSRDGGGDAAPAR